MDEQVIEDVSFYGNLWISIQWVCIATERIAQQRQTCFNHIATIDLIQQLIIHISRYLKIYIYISYVLISSLTPHVFNYQDC